MPTLHALGRRGVVFTNHHAVYPTVTRVNAASISTGSYPEKHGLLGNHVFFPAVDANAFLNTGHEARLQRIEATEGHLLTNMSLGETLQAAGQKLMVVSNGSSGSALLLNHKVSGGAIFQYDRERISSEDQRLNATLPSPTDDLPSALLNRWAVDTLLKGLAQLDPAVTILWLTDPDNTAHEHGIGAAETVESLRQIDGELKRLTDGLAADGRLDRFNIFVTSDHGFSTWTGGPSLKDLLKPFERTAPDGSPLIVYGDDGAVYVRGREPDVISRIVSALQRATGVGAIFTAPASDAAPRDGWVPGTLSFNVVRWNHKRSADILFSADWSQQANVYGVRGSASANGVASHGTTSPFDVHNTLIVAGPDVKRGATIPTPSANVDLAPTVLRLLGIAVPTSMQGRVLGEAIVGGPDPSTIGVRAEQHTTATADGAYSATASFSIVETARERYAYFDSAKADRRNDRTR